MIIDERVQCSTLRLLPSTPRSDRYHLTYLCLDTAEFMYLGIAHLLQPVPPRAGCAVAHLACGGRPISPCLTCANEQHGLVNSAQCVAQPGRHGRFMRRKLGGRRLFDGAGRDVLTLLKRAAHKDDPLFDGQHDNI